MKHEIIHFQMMNLFRICCPLYQKTILELGLNQHHHSERIMHTHRLILIVETPMLLVA